MKKWLFVGIILFIFGGTVLAEEPFKIIVLPFVDNTIIDISKLQRGTPTSKMKEYIDIIRKVITDKINQKFCQPKYLQIEAAYNQNEQYIGVLPDKEFLIKAVNELKADGIFAFEITGLSFGAYNGGLHKFSCVASCHMRTYNSKTNRYIDERLDYVGDEVNGFFMSPPKGVYEVVTKSVNEVMDKAFNKLPY